MEKSTAYGNQSGGLFQFICHIPTAMGALHSPVFSIWNGWSPTPFHGLHMDYFLAGNPAIFSFHTHYGVHLESIWSPYGVHMECTIPWTFHVLVHVDSMEFPMNLHCKFMYYSIWIPWNSPYGFHRRIHIKFRGKTTNCVVKKSVNIKN